MKTLSIKINGTERVVEFKEVYTRKIDREFNEKIFGDTALSNANVSIAPMNIQKANDYLINAMTNLSYEDIDEIATSDYDEILKIIGDIKKTPTK